MHLRLHYVAPILGFVAVVAFACSETTAANPQLKFTEGQERDTLSDVDHYQIERLDKNNKSSQIYRGDDLPKSIDMGDTGLYRYVGTGYNADNQRVAVGRTLPVQPGEILGSEVPMFFARTDRASRPNGGFNGKTGEYPVVGVVSNSNIWFLDDSSDDSLDTDAYNLAYWEHLTPPDAYLSIPCVELPCNLTNLVVVGGIFAIAIADKWALYIDAANGYASEYSLPKGLSSWSEVAGGRALPAANSASILVGATRASRPTDKILGFTGRGDYNLLKTKQARAGAALLFEEEFGLVLVGGASEGTGVEILAPAENTFEERPFPSDPVVGAALVIESDSHILRVGGLTPEGQPAKTVRIDLACTKDCRYEEVADRDLTLRNAQSYYDEGTKQTLVVGESDSGETKVYRHTANGFIEIAMSKSQRRIHATALELPNQQLALVGGTDPEDNTQQRKTISVIAF